MVSIHSYCYDAFLQPYPQGCYNMRDAVLGSRIEQIAEDALHTPTTLAVDLNLEERISAFVLGVILLVPVINTVALIILRSANSAFYYQTHAQETNTIIATTVATTTEAATTEAATTEDDSMVPELIRRKAAALQRLTQLDAMVTGSTTTTRNESICRRFQPIASILTFNLDGILNRYPDTELPSRLCEMLDWATYTDPIRGEVSITTSQRTDFRRAVQQFDLASSSQAIMAKELLSRLHAYFTQRQSVVTSDSEEEISLKQQFHDCVTRIIDADRNCVDQFNSQMQEIMLEVVVGGFADSQSGNPLERIKLRAGQMLCQYRIELLKQILYEQNRDTSHLADLERLAMQRLCARLGMIGRIFTNGAYYTTLISNLDYRINRAMNEFDRRYKPLQHLAGDLRVYFGTARKLRNALLQWLNQQYELPNEIEGTTPSNMDRRLSEDFTSLPVSEGGNMTEAAMMWLLESARLATEIV